MVREGIWRWSHSVWPEAGAVLLHWPRTGAHVSAFSTVRTTLFTRAVVLHVEPEALGALVYRAPPSRSGGSRERAPITAGAAGETSLHQWQKRGSP